MIFVRNTRIVRTAVTAPDGTAVPDARAAWNWNQYIATVAEAMALVPNNQRPAEALWGGYALTYTPRAFFRGVVYPITGRCVGVRAGTDELVVIVDTWQTAADRDNNLPALRDSHGFRNFGSGVNWRDLVRAHIDAMLIQYTQENRPPGDYGDYRNLTADPALDPAGLLQRADVQELEAALLTGVNYV